MSARAALSLSGLGCVHGSFKTSICLQYAPTTVASVALLMAAKLLRKNVYGGKPLPPCIEYLLSPQGLEWLQSKGIQPPQAQGTFSCCMHARMQAACHAAICTCTRMQPSCAARQYQSCSGHACTLALTCGTGGLHACMCRWWHGRLPARMRFGCMRAYMQTEGLPADDGGSPPAILVQSQAL